MAILCASLDYYYIGCDVWFLPAQNRFSIHPRDGPGSPVNVFESDSEYFDRFLVIKNMSIELSIRNPLNT